MNEKTCDHKDLIPEFDLEASKTLNSEQVRRRWPRTSAVCPDCGEFCVVYASLEHYVSGDW